MLKNEIVNELEITKDDFAKNTDIVPVSDPHIFSETQRMAQSQAILALAEKHPDEFNMSAVLSRILKQMKVPNINEILADTPAPEQRTSADENAAMLIGQVAYAYLQQDHIAHIQDHLQFATNPFFGQSPFADPNYLGNVIEHLKQHMTLWYINRSNGYVEQNIGKPVDRYEDPEHTAHIDRLYTAVGGHVMMDSQQIFGQFQQTFQKLIQAAQNMKNAPPVLPPDAQVVKDTAMAETQRKGQADQAKNQLAAQKLQLDMRKHLEDNQTKIAIENAKLTHQTIQNVAQAQAENQMPMQGQQPPAPPPMPPRAPVAPPQVPPQPPLQWEIKMATSDKEQKGVNVRQHKRIAMGEKLDGTSMGSKGSSSGNSSKGGLPTSKKK